MYQPIPLILASASPRRKELLTQLGLQFHIIPSQADEVPCKNATPEAYVTRLSREKALLVAEEHPHSFILAADTIVVLNHAILEKPSDPAHATQMLTQLSGNTHTVFTGFTLMHISKKIEDTQFVQAEVTFKTLTNEEISWYISTDEPYDKAGAYALQGKGSFFVQSILGSYSNVIGLPLTEVVETLHRYGAFQFIKNGDDI